MYRFSTYRIEELMKTEECLQKDFSLLDDESRKKVLEKRKLFENCILEIEKSGVKVESILNHFIYNRRNNIDFYDVSKSDIIVAFDELFKAYGYFLSIKEVKSAWAQSRILYTTILPEAIRQLVYGGELNVFVRVNEILSKMLINIDEEDVSLVNFWYDVVSYWNKYNPKEKVVIPSGMKVVSDIYKRGESETDLLNHVFVEIDKLKNIPMKDKFCVSVVNDALVYLTFFKKQEVVEFIQNEINRYILQFYEYIKGISFEVEKIGYACNLLSFIEGVKGKQVGVHSYLNYFTNGENCVIGGKEENGIVSINLSYIYCDLKQCVDDPLVKIYSDPFFVKRFFLDDDVLYEFSDGDTIVLAFYSLKKLGKLKSQYRLSRKCSLNIKFNGMVVVDDSVENLLIKVHEAFQGSSLAMKAKAYLCASGISFETEKRFNECRDKMLLPFDLYFKIDGEECLVELDGEQHFRPIDFFGGQEAFDVLQKHDKMKTEFAISNGYKFLRISYDENVQEKLAEFINNIKMSCNK